MELPNGGHKSPLFLRTRCTTARAWALLFLYKCQVNDANSRFSSLCVYYAIKVKVFLRECYMSLNLREDPKQPSVFW